MDDYGVLDIEWDANDPAHPGLVLGWGGKAFPTDSIPKWVLDELADESCIKVAFTKADHRWCAEHGIPLAGPFHDVQVMAWCLDERTELSLASVSRLYGAPMKDERLVRKDGLVWFRCDDGLLVPLGEAPLDQLAAYNEGDLSSTDGLYQILLAKLRDTGRYDYWHARHVPFSPVLLDMEMEGLPLDVVETKAESIHLGKEVSAGKWSLLHDAGLPNDFNLNSVDQLRNFLFWPDETFDWPTRIKLPKDRMALVKAGEWIDELPRDMEPTKLGREYVYGVRHLKGLRLRPVKKAPKCLIQECGHDDDNHLPSTSRKVLAVYHGDNAWVRDFCEWKIKTKGLQFLTTWLEEERDGRIHGQYNQTGTDTGRLSSSNPNLQQVPSRGEIGKRFRSLFVAPPGYVFIHADFDQIEPRLMAHYSQDPELLRVFSEGLDPYEEASVPILGKRYGKGTPERTLMKGCFLAMGYGAKPAKIRSNLAEEGFRFSRYQVEKAHSGITELYHVYWSWKDEAIAEAERTGYAETIGGHRRHISWLDESMRWKSENRAVNSKIQGSAADIFNGTMIEIATTIPQVHLCAAVHDEALGLVREEDATENVLLAFTNAGEAGHGFKLDNVDLVFTARYAKNWGEAK